jgi:hypothetical protein
MWDKDLLKWNDCIAEGTLSIGRYVKKAYKKNMIYKPFESAPPKTGGEPGGIRARSSDSHVLQMATHLMQTRRT